MNTLFSEKQCESGWYVVYTKPRQELRASENLQNQGYESFLPMLMAERLRERCLVRTEEVLFPRYLFVRLEAGRSNWSAIRSTRGVIRLVEFGGSATRVPDALVENLRQVPKVSKLLYEPGDRLKVVSGPFSGIEAELLSVREKPNGEARVMVLMEILARPQEISLPAKDVRRVA